MRVEIGLNSVGARTVKSRINVERAALQTFNRKGMPMRIPAILSATLFAGLLTSPVLAENMYGMERGEPQLQSVSALAFGPGGILFIGDAAGAAIVAVETKDAKSATLPPKEIPNIDQQLAAACNVAVEKIRIADLVVNPETKNIYLAVQAEEQSPRIFKVGGGEHGLTELELKDIHFSSAALPNAAEDKEVNVGGRKRNNRASAITDLAFANGQLLVAGLSNDQSPSNVWSLQFPFQEIDHGTTLQFYHGAHGRSEDYAPIRTFVPFIVDGEPQILAGFVCTPLVKFPLSQVTAGRSDNAKVQGTTLAELGNRNQPLDMIAYQQNGHDYFLLSNSARGVMKISTENLSRNDGITSPVPDGKTSGQPFETIEALAGTIQLEKLDDQHAVVIVQKPNGPANFKIVELP